MHDLRAIARFVRITRPKRRKHGARGNCAPAVRKDWISGAKRACVPSQASGEFGEREPQAPAIAPIRGSRQ